MLIDSFKNLRVISWWAQFKQAWILTPQLDENFKIIDVKGLDAFLHFITIGWKMLFAIVPPVRYLRGWISFFVCLAFIGCISYLIIEMASLFGWVIGLRDAATAIIFVSIGTSLPDAFVSKQAAQYSNYADNAIGNITGSNSVNVFLGLGISWFIGAIYGLIEDEDYRVSQKGVTFSVLLFLIASGIAIFIIIFRRLIFGGELGAKKAFWKWSTAILLFSLWPIYIVLSCVRIYDHITYN